MNFRKNDIISDDCDQWYVVLSMNPIRLVNTSDHSISERDGLTGFVKIGRMSAPEMVQFKAMLGVES